jgi:hypothetical protein
MNNDIFLFKCGQSTQLVSAFLDLFARCLRGSSVRHLTSYSKVSGDFVEAVETMP